MKVGPEDPRIAELHSFGEGFIITVKPTPITFSNKKEKNPNPPLDPNP